MTPESAIQEIERLTQEMVELARHEQWPELTATENKRRALLSHLKNISADQGSLIQSLRHVSELNQDLVSRVCNRRDDIGLLLEAFGGTTTPAR